MSRTLPTGPSQLASEPAFTALSYNFTIGAGNTLASSVFNCGVFRKIVCNAAGTLFAALEGDTNDDGTTAYVSYTVVAGEILEGLFVAIGGTGVGSSAMSITVQA